jgi:acyl carrier protein
MANRLYRIISDVFGVPAGEIGPEGGPDSIPKWDSLAHLSLVMSLESEFGIKLAPEEALNISSVGAIQELLEKRGVSVLEEG